MQAMSLAEDNQEAEQTDDISEVHDSLNKLLDVVKEQGRQLEELKQVMDVVSRGRRKRREEGGEESARNCSVINSCFKTF